MFTHEKLKTILPALLLLVICVFIYGPLVYNQFLLDDFYFLRFHDVFQIFKEPQLLMPSASSHHFEPLYRLGNAIAFPLLKTAQNLYLLNIFLFFINCYLLFLLVVSLTKNHRLALLTSVLFCLHPMSAEVVMHITFNNILICTALMETGLILLCKHLEQRTTWHFYVLSIAAFAMALLFQEISLLFPLYVVCLLFYKNFSIKEIFKILLPFILLAGGQLILWLSFAGPGAKLLERTHALDLSFWGFTANVFLLIKWYVLNLFSPDNIIFMFNITPVKDLIWAWNLLFLSLITGSFLLIFFPLRRKIEGFALSLFLIDFLLIIPGSLCRPHMGMVVEPYWFYFSSMGFFLLLASFILRMCLFFNKYLSIIIVGSIFIFLSLFTKQQILLGKNEISYCLNWARSSPNNTLALGTLESYFVREEKTPFPSFLLPQMPYMVDWLLQENENARAIQLIEKMLHSEITDQEKQVLLYKLAVAYYKNNEHERSEKIINSIINSNTPLNFFQLGYTFYEKGQSGKAKELLKQCQAAFPSYKETYLLLGVILANEQKYSESIGWWEKGRTLDPADTRFIKNIRSAERYQK